MFNVPLFIKDLEKAVASQEWGRITDIIIFLKEHEKHVEQEAIAEYCKSQSETEEEGDE